MATRVFEDPALTPRQCQECGEILESAGQYAQHYRDAHVGDSESGRMIRRSNEARRLRPEYSRPLIGQAIEQDQNTEEAIMPKTEDTRKYTVSIQLTPDQETALDALASLNSVSRAKLVQPILQKKIDEVVKENATVVKQYLDLRARFKA